MRQTGIAIMMPDMIKDPFARLGLDREVLTVSQLNGRARVVLEDVFSSIWVEGRSPTSRARRRAMCTSR